MNKVIHCAVRRDLERFRRALDAFTDGDRERAAALYRAWVNFDAQLTEHHEGEHEIAWPALQAIGVAEPTIASFDAEHERMATDLAATRDAMATLRRTATRADADVAAAAMEQLRATTVTHLDHEEQETESVLAAARRRPGGEGDGQAVQQASRTSHGRDLLRVGAGRRHAGGAVRAHRQRARACARGDRRSVRPALPPRRWRPSGRTDRRTVGPDRIWNAPCRFPPVARVGVEHPSHIHVRAFSGTESPRSTSAVAGQGPGHTRILGSRRRVRAELGRQADSANRSIASP